MQHECSRFANYFFQVGLGEEDLKSRILLNGEAYSQHPANIAQTLGEPEMELNLGGLFGILLFDSQL